MDWFGGIAEGYGDIVRPTICSPPTHAGRRRDRPFDSRIWMIWPPEARIYSADFPPPRLPRCWQRHGAEHIVFLLFLLRFHVIELKTTEYCFDDHCYCLRLLTTTFSSLPGQYAICPPLTLSLSEVSDLPELRHPSTQALERKEAEIMLNFESDSFATQPDHQ